MLKANYFIGCLVVASTFVSCKKTDSYDVTGDPEVKFFVNNTSFGNSPQNAINYTVVNIPDVAGSGLINLSSTVPDVIKFPVYASKPVAEEVTIGAELDNSLIEAYNTAHGTNYLPFPAGTFNTSGLSARIAKDASTSVDSITIPANVATLNALTDINYMAPVRLTTLSNPHAGALSATAASQVAYIVATVEQRRVKYNAPAADALGELITPRTSWVATFTPAPSMNGNIFDGSNTTYNRWAASPPQVDVDMQEAKNVTGIRVFTNTSTNFVPSKVDVYLSNDGIDYDYIGSPLKANLTSASGYTYILFYKAIPARYVRLKIYYSTSTSSSNLRLAELDVYAN